MTYIYETMTTTEIARRLRADEYAAWSLNGARALAEYLEEIATELGEPIELDVVALRCNYSEYDSLEAFNLSHHGEGHEDDFYKDIDALRDDAGTVIEFDGGFIVATF